MKVRLLKKVRSRVKIKERNGVFFLWNKSFPLKEADNKEVALAWYYYDVVSEARHIVGKVFKNDLK